MSPLSILPKNKKGKFDKYIFPNIFFNNKIGIPVLTDTTAVRIGWKEVTKCKLNSAPTQKNPPKFAAFPWSGRQNILVQQ